MSNNEVYEHTGPDERMDFAEEQGKIADEMTWRMVSSIDKVERLSLEPGEVLAVIVKDPDASISASVQGGFAELLGVSIDRVVVIRGDVELKVLQQQGDTPMPEWENPMADLIEAAWKLRDRRDDSSDVTVEKIEKFNRALHPHVLEAAQQAGISPHNIVMHAVFLMPGGGLLPCYLGPPLTEEDSRDD